MSERKETIIMNTDLTWRVNPNRGEDLAETVAQLSRYATGILCDAIYALKDPRNRIIGTRRVKSVKPGLKLAGAALTVKAPAGNSFPVQYAIYHGFPGAVLVVDCGGYMDGPYMGDLMVRSAQGLGYAGIVVDGCIRDGAEVAAMDFPVFVRAFNPTKPAKALEGQINVPVSVDGAEVNPGDIIIGDDDGMVIICPDCASALLPLAEAKDATDKTRSARIEAFFTKPEQERNLEEIMGADFIKALNGVRQ